MALSGVADLAGRVLGDRYRLRSSIGAGASGRVYVADDVRLRRRVAVKVLHTALADDAGFLRRFRAEAQVAASLHHPNIVAVYDWGEDGVPFMVLELLAGGSLRSLLDTGARLSPSQAAHVGRQVTAALQYAHGRGLVHRDVKPANLLFDEHGVLRVADFGLARALAEASWTEPAGAVVGTARYAAPEQATGLPLDGRADLYALSLVLVESVTGRVPFATDTALGTLAARLDRPVLAPEELGPLGAVVERAGRPDPAERYPEARTMGDALGDVRHRLPPPAPMPLAGLGGPSGEDPDPTRHGRGLASALFDQDAEPLIVDDDSTPGTTEAFTIPPDAGAARAGAPTEAVPQAPAPDPGTAPVPERAAPPAQPARGGRLVPVVVGVVVALVAGIAAVFFLSAPGGATAPVPGMVGFDRSDATEAAAAAGIVVEVDERVADDPAGTVIGQDPPAGEWVRDGATARLVVSTGPPPVPLPDVTGRTADEATFVLVEAGFVVDTTSRFDEEIPEGEVIVTEPAPGTQVARDSRVRLVISDGPAPVTVPDVRGAASYEEAESALADARLTAERRDDFSDTVPAGEIIGSEPGAGTSVPRDSTVTVIVSKGPELVTVPDVTGLTVEAATEQLGALGLEADVTRFSPGRSVLVQDPPAGTQVEPGETVTLFL